MRQARIVRNIWLGIENLLLHKLRSFLTMLGVVFGVGSVVAMLSVGEGASQHALEQIRKLGKAVISAVRGGPILNDALMEDAKLVGLDKLCKVIDTGSDYVGVIREKCSPLFLKALDTADLVIAKGQGNYETLESTRPNIFFILQAKCGAVAAHLGVNEGDLVLKRA